MVGALRRWVPLAAVTAVAVAVLDALGVPTPSGGAQARSFGAAWYLDLGFLAACCLVGIPLGRLLRLPAGALLGPLGVAAALTLSGWSMHASAPAALAVLAYAVIGLQAGLRFTRDSVRVIARILPLAVGLILVVLAACAGLGVLLAHLAGVTPLEEYLATTPGRLYAVLATAQDSGIAVTFILAVQVARVLLMLLLAPVLARTLTRWIRPTAATRGGHQPAGHGTD